MLILLSVLNYVTIWSRILSRLIKFYSSFGRAVVCPSNLSQTI